MSRPARTRQRFEPARIHRDNGSGTGVRPAASETLRTRRSARNMRAQPTIPTSTDFSAALKQRFVAQSNFRASVYTPAQPARVRVHLRRVSNSGFRFRLADAVEFPAHPDYVVDTSRATVLGFGRTYRVSTVEHLLSALTGSGVITNALIAVDGPRDSGRRRQRARIHHGDRCRRASSIKASRSGTHDRAPSHRSFATGDKVLAIVPAPAFRVRMTIAFSGARRFAIRRLSIARSTQSYRSRDRAESHIRFSSRSRSAAGARTRDGRHARERGRLRRRRSARAAAFRRRTGASQRCSI